MSDPVDKPFDEQDFKVMSGVADMRERRLEMHIRWWNRLKTTADRLLDDPNDDAYWEDVHYLAYLMFMDECRPPNALEIIKGNGVDLPCIG